MGSISDKLEYLLETKEQLKQALIDKNVDIDENTTFRNFAVKTTEDTGLVDTSDANAVADDIAKNKTAYVNGVKTTGSLESTASMTEISSSETRMTANELIYKTTGRGISLENKSKILKPTSVIYLREQLSTVANTLGITANKIKQGETICNIQGNVVELNGQTKNIAPTINPQTIEPDEGYNGITVVNIDAVTSNIDPNIISGNIKNGVTILNITGTLDGGIDTSDADAKPLDIKSGNTAYVNGQKLVGTLPVLTYPVNPYNAKDWDYQFQASTQNLKRVTRDGINYILGGHQIVNGVESWMFEGNSKMKMGFTESNIAQLVKLTPEKLAKGQKVLGVEGTLEPYSGDGWLVLPDIGFNISGNFTADDWDLSQRSDTSNMFANCSNLIEINGISNWKNTFKISNTSNMFANCRKLQNLDISGWDVSNITNMANMFTGCPNLRNLNISSINLSKVIDFSFIFNSCKNLYLSNLNISNFDISGAKNIAGFFSWWSDVKTLDVANWNISNVTNIARMFQFCNNISSLNLTNWDISNITNASYLFWGCKNLSDIDISTWIFENITDISYMLGSAGSISNLKINNSLNFSNISNMDGMLYGIKVTNLDVSNWSFNNVNSLSYLFTSCSDIENGLDVSNWSFNNVNSLYCLFSQCYNLQAVNVSNWKLSGVTNITGMFSKDNNLTDAGIDQIINMCLNATDVTYKNLSNMNSYSPFGTTNISNTRYQSRWSELTAAGWTY